MNAKITHYLLIIVFYSTFSQAQEYRYTNTLFSSSDISENIIYHSVASINAPYTVEDNTTIENLEMDIFVPQGDSNTKRPAIIFAHSGGFLLGNKNHDDMMAFCDSLSKKGYVTATINYRLGFNLVTNANLHGTRAVYRGIQDGLAAVRYLRANASIYNIDNDKIYFIGSSAGSFIGLHSIYMDSNEVPSQISSISYTNATPPFNHTAPDLGPLNIGDYLSFDGRPDAVVSLWGGLQNTNLISSNNDTPVFLVHGSSDSVVPFEIGPPFGYTVLNETYGSNQINMKLEELEIANKKTYFVSDGEHEFYGTDNGTWSNGTSGNEYWEIVFEKITSFLWEQHKPIADFNYEQGDGISNSPETVDFFDQSSGAISWLWDFGDGNTSTEQNPSHTYENLGVYEVKLYIENDILSWDKKIIEINTSLSITGNKIIDFNYFPNPTKENVYFSFENFYSSIKIQLYDIKSQLIKETTFYNQKDITFKMRDIANGLYLIKITKDQKTYMIKALKN